MRQRSPFFPFWLFFKQTFRWKSKNILQQCSRVSRDSYSHENGGIHVSGSFRLQNCYPCISAKEDLYFLFCVYAREIHTVYTGNPTVASGIFLLTCDVRNSTPRLSQFCLMLSAISGGLTYNLVLRPFLWLCHCHFL